MVNPALLHSEVQQFIRSYNEELSVLAFKGSPFEGISVQELLIQIEGFRKTKLKLPHWHTTPGIYFPPKLNLEQTSSEITARYKAALVAGDAMADLTGGLGVDTFYLAKRFKHVAYFEQNEQLSEIANHNFEQMGVTNIEAHHGDGLQGIANSHYDVIYMDPARRHESKGKVFFLKDCEPNVVEHMDYLMARCDTLLLKTSPMLDISAGIIELQAVNELHIIALENEVKELVWVIRKESKPSFQVRTINITKNGIQKFDFKYHHEGQAQFGLPNAFLYEPNAALMKAGAFSLLSEAFELDKLHLHSHLYTSAMLIDFPGRRFTIKEVIPYQKGVMRDRLLGQKAHITTRNFPESVASLRKKWKIKEGGSIYLFFTTQGDNTRIVLICSKIKASILRE